MWRKAMLYLGLAPDEDYDDYEPLDDPGLVPPRAQVPASSRYPTAGPALGAPEHEFGTSGAVRTLAPQPLEPNRPRTAVVRPIQPVPSAKPHVVAPSSFTEAQEVADKFKNKQPVIVNLQNVDRDLTRRIIDFASGLCYGLGGQMEKVANQVYLLTPTNVEVSAEERRRLQERGFNEQ
jgi:cell division inhibitor SepF